MLSKSQDHFQIHDSGLPIAAQHSAARDRARTFTLNQDCLRRLVACGSSQAHKKPILHDEPNGWYGFSCQLRLRMKNTDPNLCTNKRFVSMRYLPSVLDAIGNTPLIRLKA